MAKKPFEPRKYVCATWPFLRLRKGVKFDRGFYTAATQEMADIVEASESFGGAIRLIQEKVVENNTDGMTGIEEQLMKTLKKKVPAVRKGVISSADMVG
jgi:hypothetical protein